MLQLSARSGPNGLCVLLLAAATAIGCATHTTAKGGLVPLGASEKELDAARAGQRLALVVGIDRFDDPAWHPLRFASKDARDLAAVLRDPMRGSFNEVLERSDAAQNTRAGILDALHALRERNTSKDDVVLLYFSTHGTLARVPGRGVQRYMVAADTRLRDVVGTGLSLEEVQAELEKLPSRRKVLVLAMCHSGTGKSLLPPELQDELDHSKGEFFPRPLEEQSRAQIVLAACDWSESAREDDRLENDIYTHFLVEALAKPADRNGDGAVTATEAHDYARRRTYEYTEGQQRPSAQLEEVGADPVVLSGRFERAGRPELYGYQASLDGLELRVDGAPEVTLPGGMALAPGAHHVQVLKGDGKALVDTDLSLQLGERVDVDDLVARTHHVWRFGAALGYEGFLDSQSRETLAGSTPAVRLWAFRPDLIARHVGVLADASFSAWSGGLQVLPGEAPVPFEFLAGEAGLAAPYWGKLWELTLDAGPRLGGLFMQRRFDLRAFQGSQSYFVLSPGLTAGVTYPLTDSFDLTARADCSAVVVAVDQGTRTVARGGFYLGLEWSR